MKKILYIVIVLLFIGGFLVFNEGIFFVDPSSSKKNNSFVNDEWENVGFLASWMIGKTRLYEEEIDKLIFSGVEIDSQGNLIWDSQSNKIFDKDYLQQKEKIKEGGGENILGIKLFKDEELDLLLENKEARQNLIKEVKKVIRKNDFDGINIDFEYQSDPKLILDNKFIVFLEELKDVEVGEVGVDVFVNTINKGNKEELEELLKNIDQLMVMAYDFHRPGSDFAGSVAPIRASLGERSIWEVVKKMVDLELDKDKIVLAYPLYGYEWKTINEEYGSRVEEGSCQMVSWQRSKELIEEKNLEEKWNELTMSPWLVYKENDEIYQVYYENEKSLGIKVQLARDNQFGGVAWWSLGYEGKDNLFDY